MTCENIREFAVDIQKSLFRGVTGNDIFVDKVKASQVINPVDMVCMGMGKENGINVRNALPYCLGTEIRGGVDQDVSAFILDQQGGACSGVLWIS